MADRRRRRKPVTNGESDESSDESIDGAVNHTLSDLVSEIISEFINWIIKFSIDLAYVPATHSYLHKLIFLARAIM